MFLVRARRVAEVFIIMEYLGGGSLHAYLKKRSARRLDDARARRIFTQACAGLKSALANRNDHSKFTAHRSHETYPRSVAPQGRLQRCSLQPRGCKVLMWSASESVELGR